MDATETVQEQVFNRHYTVNLTLEPLQEYFDDPQVTEIRFNRPGQVVCQTHTGKQIIDRPDLDWNYLGRLRQTLIHTNKLADDPVVNLILPNGARGIICMPPAVIEGSILVAFRKHSAVVKTLEQLDAEGAFADWRNVSFNQPTPDEAAERMNRRDFQRLDEDEVELLGLLRERDLVSFFRRAVQTKRNIVIAGKTGSGKTTLNRTFLLEVPASERIITIEDVHELFLREEQSEEGHLLYGKPEEGRMSVSDCLAACMRLSPDRIFLAELRDSAALEYLEGLNNGHPGSITTTHAGSALMTFNRIVTLIRKSEAGRLLDVNDIMRELYTTIDITVFMHERKIKEVFYDPIFKRERLG
jgi:type IV secretion system protein VirB11